EMNLYMQSVPGLLNTPQGNLALIMIGQKIARARIREFQRWEQFVAQSPDNTDVGFQFEETDPKTGQPVSILSPDEVNYLKSLQGAPAPGGAATPSAGGGGAAPGSAGGPGSSPQNPIPMTPEQFQAAPSGTWARTNDGRVIKRQ